MIQIACRHRLRCGAYDSETGVSGITRYQLRFREDRFGGDVNGVFPHILPPPPLNENKKSYTRGLFRLAAFGRFLGCLFLGHCASFPLGWTPQRAKTVDAAHKI